MGKALALLWACAVMVLGVGTAEHLNGEGGTSSARNAAVQQWFNKMDISRDGQLQESELRQFIGAQLGPIDFNTGRKLDHAIEQVTEKLDSEDLGMTISMKELGQYLHKALQGVKVSDWISHSLGLPMYAEAFRDNAITVLDFPLLVNDGGRLLETELMVTRVLHRQKILRAMQRQMLGLGVEPGRIALLQCSSNSKESGSSAEVGGPAGSNTAAGGGSSSNSSNQSAGGAALHPGLVHCVWVQPDSPGEPALHKYVLERFAMHRPGAMWQPVAELDDTVMTQFNDMVELPGTYQYRLTAWNLYGRSAHTFSDEVVVASPSRAVPAAAGAALLGTDSLAQQEQQRAPPQHNAAAAGDHGVMHLKNTECKLVHFNESTSDIINTGDSRQTMHQISTDSMTLAQQHQQKQKQQKQHDQQQQQPPNHIEEAALGNQPQQQYDVRDLALAVVHATQSALQAHDRSSSSALPNAGQGAGSSSSRLPSDLVRYTGGFSERNACSSSRPAQQALPNAFAPAAHTSSCSISSNNACHPHPGHSPTDDLLQDPAAYHQSNGLVVATRSTAATAAAQSPVTAAPNVVWVVSPSTLTDGTRSTPAAIVAQVQLLQSMQAAAGVEVAEAAAGQSSQANIGQNSMGRSAASAGNKAAGKWSAAALFVAWVGKWLKALVNSLLLLVLPACVRLLPVPVLHRLASALAHALQLLPQPLQRVVRKLGAVAGVEQQQHQQDQQQRTTASVQPDEAGLAVRTRAVGVREVGSVLYSKRGQRPLSSTTTTATVSSGPGVHSDAPSAGSSTPIGAPVADANAVQHAVGQRGSVGRSPSRENLEECGVNDTLIRQQSPGMTKSSSEVGLMRHWPNSPGSSSTGRQLAHASGAAAAASPARVAAAGPYAGVYGFAWQTGPAFGRAAAAAITGGASNAASEIQAVYAAIAPDRAEDELQQQQRQQAQAQDLCVLVPAGPGHACDDNSNRGGHAYVPEELRVTSRMPNRKRCAFPGCNQQFDLRHLRAMMQRHYCGRCQQAFCLAHTAYSPHGPGGGCGAESRCVCCSCIFDFTPEYRLFLMSRNTLQTEGSRRTRSGPPAGRGSSEDGGRCSPARRLGSAPGQTAPATSKSSPALQQQQEQQAQVPGWLRMGLNRSSDGLLQRDAACSSTAPAGKAAAAIPQAVTAGEAVAAAAQAAPAGAKQMKSRMLWCRAWTKATAVVRLSHAGQQHQEQQQVLC